MASNTVVQTNVLALNSHRNLGQVGVLKERSSQKLSSGYRINSAADDAAGLAISEKMRAQIRGLDMASKNTQDGISLIQTAEGGMQEIDNMLQRIRELVDYASNDTQEYSGNGTDDRQKIQDEVNQLIEAIDQMAGQVEFNKKRVIDGSFMDKASEVIRIGTVINNIGTIAGTGTLKTAFDDKVGTPLTALWADIKTAAALTAITGAPAAGTVSGAIATAGNIDKMLEAIQKDIGGADPSTAAGAKEIAALKALRDGLINFRSDQAALDYATNYQTALGTLGTNSGLYFQTGANSNQGIQISIGSVNTNFLGIGDGHGESKIDVVKNTGTKITGYLDTLDNALSYVTKERSKLGAVQNRLEYTDKSLQVSSENLSNAESRIRDTDMGKEMMNLTKANILQQAAVSMLAQANQAPQSILQLLQ